MQSLVGTLHAAGPTASLALRALVGGEILVKEVLRPGYKRHFTQGKFIIRACQVLGSLSSSSKENGGCHQDIDNHKEEIIVDFRVPKCVRPNGDQHKPIVTT
jgi:hypothetical protein